MDFNDDGVLDLVLGERYGQYFFYTGNGDGTLHFAGHPWDDMGSRGESHGENRIFFAFYEGLL